MMKRVYILLSLILILLVVGCGRSPSANLYTLELNQAEVAHSTDAPSNFSVGLRQVNLPPVLRRPQIVLIEDEQVTFQEYHLWSESLDQAMLRTLSNDLRNQLKTSSILSYPWPTAFDPLQTLTINVDRFSGLPAKTLELVGVWIVSHKDNSQPVRVERFNIVVKVEGDDYSALVRAHSVALNQLAGQLAVALTPQ